MTHLNTEPVVEDVVHVLGDGERVLTVKSIDIGHLLFARGLKMNKEMEVDRSVESRGSTHLLAFFLGSRERGPKPRHNLIFARNIRCS